MKTLKIGEVDEQEEMEGQFDLQALVKKVEERTEQAKEAELPPSVPTGAGGKARESGRSRLEHLESSQRHGLSRTSFGRAGC